MKTRWMKRDLVEWSWWVAVVSTWEQIPE